jgi:16S rRNA (cytosine1402-N4)-methyltransferase
MEFKHIPIMLNECLDGLNIKPNGIYVDGTIGGAGHSNEILKRLDSDGLLIGIDKDVDAIKASTERLSKISNNFKIVKDDFKDFDNILSSLNIDKVDGVLLDLGVSSYQLDNAERGFSYREDAKLDMRMDKSQKLSAYEVVNYYNYEELSNVIYKYGEERFSRQIASKIVKLREEKPIETTLELANIVESCYPKKLLFKGGSVAKKTFQAIRIEVNGELTKLDEVLHSMVNHLNKGGRICVITFHSLEDRIVKDAFKEMSTDCICPPSAIICVCHHKASIKLINRKPLVPSEEEQKINSRSTSAKLRIIEKL